MGYELTGVILDRTPDGLGSWPAGPGAGSRRAGRRSRRGLPWMVFDFVVEEGCITCIHVAADPVVPLHEARRAP